MPPWQSRELLPGQRATPRLANRGDRADRLHHRVVQIEPGPMADRGPRGAVTSQRGGAAAVAMLPPDNVHCG